MRLRVAKKVVRKTYYDIYYPRISTCDVAIRRVDRATRGNSPLDNLRRGRWDAFDPRRRLP